MNMNRSNSFVSSLKWWPLQGHNNNNTNHQNNQTVPLPSHVNGLTNGIGGGGGGGGGGGIWHFNKTSTFGSSVAVQKLRESKWFKRDEQRIFCAVVECGFLVEVRRAPALNLQKTKLQQHKQLKCNNSYEDDIDDDEDDSDELNDTDEQDENATPAPVTSWFGIVLCKTAKDNKPKPESIEIFSVKISKKGSFKMIKMSLDDIWNNGWELRINNFADKEKTPHNEKDIRNQVSFARKAKNSLWNNDKHFVYWCRYGQRQQDVRKRQMSECVKWGSVGMNAGMLLLMNKQKSLSTSK